MARFLSFVSGQRWSMSNVILIHAVGPELVGMEMRRPQTALAFLTRTGTGARKVICKLIHTCER